MAVGKKTENEVPVFPSSADLIQAATHKRDKAAIKKDYLGPKMVVKNINGDHVLVKDE